MHEIYLRRRSRLYVAEGEGKASLAELATVQKEIAHLGYVLSEQVVARIATLESAALSNFLRSLMHDLRHLTGAHRAHLPLYPGFPAQVLRLSEAELFLNALKHYFTLKRLPQSDNKRPPLFEGKPLQQIDLGTREDFESIFTQLAGMNSSLSQQDKDDLSWYVRQYQHTVFRLLPSKFPYKENLAFLGGLLILNLPAKDIPIDWFSTHFTTATDILRLAVAISGGDVSLATSCKFKSFKRHQRRLILALLDRAEPTEDMLRWAERWKRLGECLHPGDMSHRYPKAHAAFQVLRNKTPYRTFNSRVEQALATGNTTSAAAFLEGRPGEYARRLDVLLRRSPVVQKLIGRFSEIAQYVSTPVLLQVLAHFKNRINPGALRVYFPKGEVAKVFAMIDQRTAIPTHVIEQVVQVCESALIQRFSQLPPLGSCYIDPALRNCTVPLSQRSASKSLRTLGRGSRLPISNGEVIRLFLWWMNGRSRTDIDLSAVLYGEKYDYLDTLAYYKLRKYGAHHSGDIVDAPKGAAEFIDLDFDRLRESGVRFVVMVINSYTAQPYCDLPECFAGWMLRKHPNSGEVFEPRTVIDKVDIASDTKICIPLILDLVNREMLWADIALKEQPRWNNVHNNLTGVSLMLRALTSMVKPDLQTLFKLHVKARGVIVEQQKDADVVFSLHEGVTPFCTDDIRSSYL